MKQTATTKRLKQIKKTPYFKKNSFLLVGMALLINLLSINPLFAQGVAAGTDISNTVVVNYKLAGIDQAPIESSPTGNKISGIGNGTATQFIVDRKIDLSLTGNVNANVNPGETQAEVTFTLLNESNDSQEFSLLPNSTLSTDDFDITSCTYQVLSVTGIPLTGVILPSSGNIKLKADQQANISVKCDIPAFVGGQPLVSGNSSLLSLIATAVKNNDGSSTSQSNGADSPNNIETVFADNAGTDDAIRDASHSARRRYFIANSTASPSISIDKSIVNISDSSGGSTAVTGSQVTYKILITTAGIGTIDNLIITDPTPTGMNYKTGSILLNNSNLSDSSDADSADFGFTNTNTATINLGNIAAGSQHEIQLSYIIN